MYICLYVCVFVYVCVHFCFVYVHTCSRNFMSACMMTDAQPQAYITKIYYIQKYTYT
jgi:hypothetical protein